MTQPNIGIKLGFGWQMIHVAYANDVVHLHNIEQKRVPPPITPHQETNNL